MAKLSDDKTYVLFEGGNDTLWSIAEDYLGDPWRWTEIAAVNNVKTNAAKTIAYVSAGTKLYFNADHSPLSSAISTNVIDVDRLELLSTSKNELFATWKWSKDSETQGYKVLWTYDIGNGVRLGGNPKTISVDEDNYASSKVDTYTIPDGARTVYFKVKPISKVKNTETGATYWNIDWSSEKNYVVEKVLAAPSSYPTVEISDDYVLTATVSGLNINGATHVIFEVVKDDKSVFATTSTPVEIVTECASYTCAVEPGGKYKVRCKVCSYDKSTKKIKDTSDWTSYSPNVTTVPTVPTGFTAISATSSDSIYLEWNQVSAESDVTYDIQYAHELTDFENTSEDPTTETGISGDHFEFKNLTETGIEYYFRIRASNAKGASEWSEISDPIVLGEAPGIPTTWSSTTTAIVGENVTLYWVHNSKDGSSQTYAKIELIFDGDESTKLLYTLEDAVDTEVISYTPLSEDDKEEGKINSCILKTSTFTEGTKIEWHVKTAGITKEYCEDWSTKRTINVYAKPTLTLNIYDKDNELVNELIDAPLTSFPWYANAIAGPRTQAPIGYHLTVTSQQAYETVDNLGNPRLVNNGEIIYSNHFDTFEPLAVIFTPGNIDLDNSMRYTVTCTASMDSGLIAEDSVTFIVAWDEVSYEPNAEIGIDPDTLTATIRPYCTDNTMVRYKVLIDGITDDDISTVDAYIDQLKLDIINSDTIIDNDRDAILAEIVKLNNVDDEGVSRLFTPTYLIGIDSIRMLIANTKTITENDSEMINSRLDYLKAYVTKFTYTKTEETIDSDRVYGETLFSVVTATGDRVYYGTTAIISTWNGTTGVFEVESGGDRIYYCEMLESVPITNVLLSVYRREYDGKFTEIATNLNGAVNVAVTDPHPALDYARYRIVATSKDTGAVGYYDLPGHKVGGTAIVIQWNEEWTSFETSADEQPEQPLWSGSLLKLPYNIDVSEATSPDVSFIEYIGREHPVTYYGTQIGESARWSTNVPKSDKETIYALRRLAKWMDNVYIREPSGVGYWANITVNFSQKHCDLVVPVNFSIRRVEGGV